MSGLEHYQTMQKDGVVTHVVVPVEEFRRLAGSAQAGVAAPGADEIGRATAILRNPRTSWHDGEGVFQEIVREGIEHARRVRKLSQAELGRAVGLSQPQVSRLENAPEHATLGMLRRVAEALAGSSQPARGARRARKA